MVTYLHNGNFSSVNLIAEMETISHPIRMAMECAKSIIFYVVAVGFSVMACSRNPERTGKDQKEDLTFAKSWMKLHLSSKAS